MVDGRGAEGMRRLLDAVEHVGDGVHAERERVLALIDDEARRSPLTATRRRLGRLRKAVESGEERS